MDAYIGAKGSMSNGRKESSRTGNGLWLLECADYIILHQLFKFGMSISKAHLF
jgi:hypothetical protein